MNYYEEKFGVRNHFSYTEENKKAIKIEEIPHHLQIYPIFDNIFTSHVTPCACTNQIHKFIFLYSKEVKPILPF